MCEGSCSKQTCQEEEKDLFLTVQSSAWLKQKEPDSDEYEKTSTAFFGDSVIISLTLGGTDNDEENHWDGKKIKVRFFDEYEENKELFFDENKKEPISIEIIKDDYGYFVESETYTIPESWNARTVRIVVDGYDTGNEDIDKKLYHGAALEVRIDYAELRIVVIDCRSGKPIKNALVKKLIIKVGEKVIIEEFPRVHKILKPKDNKEIVKNSMHVLKALKYSNATVRENVKNYYKEPDWVPAYNNYWKDRVVVPEVKKEVTNDQYKTLMKLMCIHYDGHSSTDAEGLLKIFIPKPLLDGNEASIEVGFYDFPVALERVRGGDSSRVLRKSGRVLRWGTENNSGVETGFDIKWNTTNNSQELENNELKWGSALGWEIHNGEEMSELKVSEIITIKKGGAKFDDFAMEILSPLYNPIDFIEPHFALIAMEWCQPVWDGIEDDGTRSYVQDANYSNLNMHIVTTYYDLGGSEVYGGKGYGKAELRTDGSAYLWRSRAHRGIDLHAGVGDNVFAIHGGTMTRDTSSGNTANLRVVANNIILPLIGYMHLNDFVNANNDYVMAGKIIGHAGRTGNLFPISNQPGHVHMNLNTQPIHELGVRTILSHLHISNLNVIPCNEYPLLLPCACAVTSTDNPANCNFNNADFATPCWAAAELRCPHILDADKRNWKIQLQLRVLGYYNGRIHGNLNSQTQKAIYDFKSNYRDEFGNNLLITIPGQTSVPANYEMSENDEHILDQMAPIQVNNNN